MSIISNWAQNLKDETSFPWNNKKPNVSEEAALTEEELEHIRRIEGKSGMDKFWPIFAAGAGLFSDGYVNNVCKIRCKCLSFDD